MIEAEVTIQFDNIANVSDWEFQVEDWLFANLGNPAEFRDQVDEKNAWCVTSQWKQNIYHFAREKDATLFALRWAE